MCDGAPAEADCPGGTPALQPNSLRRWGLCSLLCWSHPLPLPCTSDDCPLCLQSPSRLGSAALKHSYHDCHRAWGVDTGSVKPICSSVRRCLHCADAPLAEQQGKQQPVQAALACMDALFDLCQARLSTPIFCSLHGIVFSALLVVRACLHEVIGYATACTAGRCCLRSLVDTSCLLSVPQ